MCLSDGAHQMCTFSRPWESFKPTSRWQLISALIRFSVLPVRITVSMMLAGIYEQEAKTVLLHPCWIWALQC